MHIRPNTFEISIGCYFDSTPAATPPGSDGLVAFSRGVVASCLNPGLTSMTPPGTVWDGVGRCGTVWDGVGRCGTVWDGVGRCGTVWDGVGRCEPWSLGAFSGALGASLLVSGPIFVTPPRRLGAACVGGGQGAIGHSHVQLCWVALVSATALAWLLISVGAGHSTAAPTAEFPTSCSGEAIESPHLLFIPAKIMHISRPFRPDDMVGSLPECSWPLRADFSQAPPRQSRAAQTQRYHTPEG